MPAPPKRPVSPPLRTPPRKPCEDCKGSGKKPLKYLGEVTDPCPSCGGSGTIEVVEDPLTPWQQQVLTLLHGLGIKLDLLSPQQPSRPHPPADLKPMDCFEVRKP